MAPPSGMKEIGQVVAVRRPPVLGQDYDVSVEAHNDFGGNSASHNVGRSLTVRNTDDGSDPQVSTSGLGAIIPNRAHEREHPPTPPSDYFKGK